MSVPLPVVFLPGNLCDERLWLPLWRLIDIHDRRYVPLQWAETLEQMTGLTEHAIGDDKVHLIGFSMGGFIAALSAIAQPHKIASLTLVGFNPNGLSQTDMQQKRELIKRLQLGKVPPMSKARLDQFIFPHHPNAQSTREQVQAMESDLGNAVLKYQLQATSQRPNLIVKLINANIPIHIIATEHDQIAPLSALQQAQKKLTNSHWHSVKNSGHMLPLEQPEELAILLTQIISA